jgi:hypothetical protein
VNKAGDCQPQRREWLRDAGPARNGSLRGPGFVLRAIAGGARLMRRATSGVLLEIAESTGSVAGFRGQCTVTRLPSTIGKGQGQRIHSRDNFRLAEDPLAVQLAQIRDRRFFSQLLWSWRGRIGPNRDGLSFCAILAEAMVRIEMWRVPSLENCFGGLSDRFLCW